MATLTQLEYIVALDRLKHFGRAAEACFVSQPALSAQIQKLEEELNLSIFDRSKKPILTTDAGQLIIDQAKKILFEHQKLFHISLQDSEHPSGPFRLAIIPTLSSSVLPLFLTSFQKKYPEVQLEIVERTTSECIEMLDRDTIDAAILVTPLEEDRFQKKVLFTEPFYLFVHDKHPLIQKKSIKSSDLVNDDLWLLSEGHCFRNQVLNICETQSRPSRGRFESGHLQTLIELVRHGEGSTLLPELMTHSLREKEKRMNLKPFSTPHPQREVSLVAARTVYKEAIIKALTEVIQASVKKKLKQTDSKKSETISIALDK